MIPTWVLERAEPTHWIIDEPTIVGVSGGRTSAMMAALYDHFNPTAGKDLVFAFENTGREHEKTYEFLNNLSSFFSRPLHWLEIRPPLVLGAPPSQMRVEEVKYASAARKGEPFETLLSTMANYRRLTKGIPSPACNLAPKPMMRLCTAYMKIRAQEMYVRDVCGWETYTSAIGLRADEPRRTAKVSARDTNSKSNVCPLSLSGFLKQDVNTFWEEQPFTLEISENLGNCTLCFLKDESDLAWNLLHEVTEEEREWWFRIQDEYGSFRGRASIDYRQIFAEAPLRFEIREQLQNHFPVAVNGNPKRIKSLVRQELRVLTHGLVRTPCSCESAELMTDEFIQIQPSIKRERVRVI